MNQSRIQSQSHSTDGRWDLPSLDAEWENHPGDAGEPLDLRYSGLYHQWYDRVASGNPNDYIIAITADPRTTGVSGSGKTTLGGGLAKDWFDHSDGGFDAETQYTLDPQRLAYEMYPATDELSVLIHDEAQGTPASTGLNAKRSNTTQALDAINAVAAGRSDRKTVVFILQDLKFLNKDAITYIDSWLLIRDDHDYVATHYAVAPDVFDLRSREIKTPGIEQITWDALPADDPDYQVMEERKEQAKAGQSEFTDDDEDDEQLTEIPKPLRDQKIVDLYEAGISQSDIGEAFGLTQQTISQIISETQ